MKISSIFIIIIPLLLLLLVSGLTVDGGEAARIPEHTCHKVIDYPKKRCNLQKCIQECSEKPNGRGECKQSFCFCTYYCRNPPAL